MTARFVPEEPGLVRLTADNPGPFTLDGTRTFVVGDRSLAVIDPGPAHPGHVQALRTRLEEAASAVVLVTHGHADHAGAAHDLAAVTGSEPRGRGTSRRLEDGDRVATDVGDLVVVDTPGHAAEHVSFFWPERRALFVGDLLLGEGDTTWVAGYEGCVADYLASLDRVETLRPERIYPAHGPPIEDPPAAVERFRRHRLERIEQVREALGRASDLNDLVDRVYGPLPSGVAGAARESLRAILDHLDVEL